MQFKYNDGEIKYEVQEGRLSVVLDDGSAISVDADCRIIIPRGKRHNVMNVIPESMHPICRFYMNIQGELDFRTLLKD
jgi:mannose-6-phosphate isomerase-like protein (cupin superfamily)